MPTLTEHQLDEARQAFAHWADIASEILRDVDHEAAYDMQDEEQRRAAWAKVETMIREAPTWHAAATQLMQLYEPPPHPELALHMLYATAGGALLHAFRDETTASSLHLLSFLVVKPDSGWRRNEKLL